jgi:hypothetical protein
LVRDENGNYRLLAVIGGWAAWQARNRQIAEINAAIAMLARPEISPRQRRTIAQTFLTPTGPADAA